MRNLTEEERKMEAKSLADLFSFDMTPYAQPRTYAGGEVIFSEGQRTAQLLYLTEGKAKCYVSQANGTISVNDLASAPCFLGEMELMGIRETTVAVTALTNCRCWLIDLSQCREQLLGDPKFLRVLCGYVCEKVLRINEMAARNQTYPLKNRLATFIAQTQQEGYYRERHSEVAPYLGVTYRHLLYVLAELGKEGILEKTDRGYRVVDQEGLQALCIQ
jgi:CRP-like cAMP-binding protein